jgi:hypothetical protein
VCLCLPYQIPPESLILEAEQLLTDMGFDTSVLLPVEQAGCLYEGFNDPYVNPTTLPTPMPTSTPTVDSCPPPGFHSAPFVNLTQWSTNPLNENISWFAQKQMPIIYLLPEDFYCVATTYSPLNEVFVFGRACCHAGSCAAAAAAAAAVSASASFEAWAYIHSHSCCCCCCSCLSCVDATYCFDE